MKNSSVSKTPINKSINQKIIYKNKLKEERNDSISKNINKKSFRNNNANAKKIKFRNKNNEDFISRTQLEKEESKKVNNSLLYSKSKDKQDKNLKSNESSKKYN